LERWTIKRYKFENEIIHDKFFKELSSKYPNFEYHVIISRDENYSGEKGRVQNLLEKNISKEFAGDFYLCGLFDMIKEIGIILTTERKVLKDRIIFERYD